LQARSSRDFRPVVVTGTRSAGARTMAGRSCFRPRVASSPEAGGGGGGDTHGTVDWCHSGRCILRFAAVVVRASRGHRRLVTYLPRRRCSCEMVTGAVPQRGWGRGASAGHLPNKSGGGPPRFGSCVFYPQVSRVRGGRRFSAEIRTRGIGNRTIQRVRGPACMVCCKKVATVFVV